MKLKKMTLKLMFTLFFLGMTPWVSAQDYQINMEGGIDPVSHPVANFLTTNAGYSYTIGAENADGNVSYFVDVDNPLDPDSGLSLTLPVGAVDPSDPLSYIVLAPNGNIPVADTYSFEIDAGDGSNVASKTFDVIVEEPRDAVSVVFVLDRSGSMGSAPHGGSGDITRMFILETAASLFINKLDAFREAGDEIALTYFDSSVDNPAAGFGANLTPIEGNAGLFTVDIEDQEPDGSTAMGDGLLTAKNKLSPANPNKSQFVFLFTDGEQNVGNLVNDAGTEAGGQSLNHVDNSIQIVTIGTGAAASGASVDRLQAIAEENIAEGSEARYFVLQEEVDPTGLGTDFNTSAMASDFFDEGFQSMLSGSSPQTIGSSNGMLNGSNPQVREFKINANIDKIIFELITPDSEPDFTIEKDGTQITRDNVDMRRIGGPNNGTNSLLKVIDLKSQPAGGIISEGTWKISVLSGTGGQKPYQVKAQVDDHRLDYTFEVDTDDAKVLDVMRMNANLTYDRTPLENATISAIVFKPGAPLGDVLARANVKLDPSDTGDSGSVGYQKLLALIDQNPALIDSLGLQENILPLVHTGDGNYSAQFSDTDVSGVYQILATISGSNANIGDYNRLIRRTVYLRFGDPDPEASSMNYTQTGVNSFQLEYTPMYFVNGETLFVGPGYGGGLNIVGTNVNNVSTVDNGDGSYTIDVTTTDGDTNPDISVVLSGEEVFQGEAADFDNKGGILDDFEDWLQNTFGISLWLFFIILILILLIIWIIKKFIK